MHKVEREGRESSPRWNKRGGGEVAQGGKGLIINIFIRCLPILEYWCGHFCLLYQVIGERDILGTQLVRRNDELALLYEKIKIQQSTLNKGELQYNQRLEDIRVLKLEIRRLRRERTTMQRSISNVDDLRYIRPLHISNFLLAVAILLLSAY